MANVYQDFTLFKDKVFRLSSQSPPNSSKWAAECWLVHQPSFHDCAPCFTMSLFSRLDRVTADASPRFLRRMSRCFLSKLFFTLVLISRESIDDVAAELDWLLTSPSKLLSVTWLLVSRYGLCSLFWLLNSSSSQSSLICCSSALPSHLSLPSSAFCCSSEKPCSGLQASSGLSWDEKYLSK